MSLLKQRLEENHGKVVSLKCKGGVQHHGVLEVNADGTFAVTDYKSEINETWVTYGLVADVLSIMYKRGNSHE